MTTPSGSARHGRTIELPGPSGPVLAESTWRARQAAHRARADAVLAAHADRSRRGIAHPVEDFLFEYYPTRPGRLRRWSPGLGVTLAGDTGDLRQLPLIPTPGGMQLDPHALAHRHDGLEWVASLLSRTSNRQPMLGCFGLHEWAMVHRSDRIRHPQLGLRLTADEVAGVVEERGVRCTHFDAFRFFTAAARPLNERVLTRAGQPDDDQPGCLHVTMDLYKWAGKAFPLVASDLVLDCFELALDVRWIDMRASPYDLSSLPDPGGDIRTTAPILIETSAGRAEYVRWQRTFAERAAPLRSRLLRVIRAATGRTMGE